MLITFTAVDMFFSKWLGWYDAIHRVIWVLFSAYIAIITLQHLSLAWFLASALALRALWLVPILWRNQYIQWWQWQAWCRDSSAALIMFLWLIYW